MIARQEKITDAHAQPVQELADSGFIGFDPDRPNTPVVLNPLEAVERKLTEELEEAERRVARLKQLPQLSEELGHHYEAAQWRAGGGSEFLDHPAMVNARLDAVVGTARVEILAAQPGGPRTRELLERSVQRDTLALDRGVRLRTLYRDTVRDNKVTAEYAQIMTGHGAGYRTLAEPYQRFIVVDRKVAFVSDFVVEGSPPHSAWQITDRAVVAWIAAVFDDGWRRAAEWRGQLRTPGPEAELVDAVTGTCGVITTPLERAILRDLADGVPQRVSARNLGISLRTLTDAMTRVKAAAGVKSLGALMYWFALSTDRHVDDSAPTTGAAGAEEGVAA